MAHLEMVKMINIVLVLPQWKEVYLLTLKSRSVWDVIGSARPCLSPASRTGTLHTVPRQELRSPAPSARVRARAVLQQCLGHHRSNSRNRPDPGVQYRMKMRKELSGLSRGHCKIRRDGSPVSHQDACPYRQQDTMLLDFVPSGQMLR